MASPAGPANDFSKTSLAGTSEELFPAVDFGSIETRTIHNPNAANPIAINPSGGAAALNTGGSITLAALATITLRTTSQINVIGTAGDDVTAFSH